MRAVPLAITTWWSTHKNRSCVTSLII